MMNNKVFIHKKVVQNQKFHKKKMKINSNNNNNNLKQ